MRLDSRKNKDFTSAHTVLFSGHREQSCRDTEMTARSLRYRCYDCLQYCPHLPVTLRLRSEEEDQF
jgi:hypothetical protein